MWSAGAVYASLLGREPADFLLESTVCEVLSPLCVSFLRQSLAEDPEKRLSSEEAELHPWLL